ncbi:MAG TPA: hypothetical protein VGP57_25370 [Actinoplanes sp.]|jgi:hypothetical protein|nr:hypothetical protein [Actinoplanes sp.]
MATAELTQTSGFVALSRAFFSVAAEVAAGVERAMVGTGNVRTAQSNAWDAICADRARAQARADMDRTVAALLENGPRTKRRRKASLVSTGTGPAG